MKVYFLEGWSNCGEIIVQPRQQPAPSKRKGRNYGILRDLLSGNFPFSDSMIAQTAAQNASAIIGWAGHTMSENRQSPSTLRETLTKPETRDQQAAAGASTFVLLHLGSRMQRESSHKSKW